MEIAKAKMRETARCKGCGTVLFKEDLNRKGYCRKCAVKRLVNSIDNMIERKGEFYEKWLKNIRRALNKLEKETEERREEK